uniref:Uncharacterized protein n=1 Tax=Oryza glumipatula TaxID=40148 RepID=A0A0E0AH02_9ORYZ
MRVGVARGTDRWPGRSRRTEAWDQSGPAAPNGGTKPVPQGIGATFLPCGIALLLRTSIPRDRTELPCLQSALARHSRIAAAWRRRWEGGH